MNFIIGGAYQGKHELAQKKFGITDDEVFICTYNPENDPKNRDGDFMEYMKQHGVEV